MVALAIPAATDACAVCTAGGGHSRASTSNGDILPEASPGALFVLFGICIAAADACTAFTAGGRHMGTGGDRNIDSLTRSCNHTIPRIALAAADACTAACTVGNDRGVASGDGNIATASGADFVTAGVFVTLAAANACTAITAGGGNIAAGDGDVVGITAGTLFGTANASTAGTAGGGQRAGGIRSCAGLCSSVIVLVVGDQQLVIGISDIVMCVTPLFQCCVTLAASQGVVAIQLDVHNALCGNGGLAGAAGVNVRIFQRHIGFGAGCRFDGDRVFIAVAGDDGFVLFRAVLDITGVILGVSAVILILPLAHIAVAVGICADINAAIANVIGRREHRRRAGRHHGEEGRRRKHTQCQTIFLLLHLDTP